MGLGLLLFGAVGGVLKDGSERGRLGSSTFKLLNVAFAAAAAVGTYYFWQVCVLSGRMLCAMAVRPWWPGREGVRVHMHARERS